MDNPIEQTKTPAELVELKQKVTGKVLKTSLQGALVDIGSKLPAFIHISQVVKDNDPKIPVNNLEDVLKEDQVIDLWVKRVRKDRIELTMIEPLTLEWRDLKPEMVLKGKVVRLETFGVFVDIGTERPGLVHISELAHNYVRTPGEVVKEGDEVDVKILELNKKKKQIKLSMKALQEVPEEPEKEEAKKPARRGKQAKKEVIEEPVIEEVIPDPTAMEIALRQAMERQQVSRKAQYEAAMRSKKNKNDYSAQDEIFERTLKNKSNSD